MYFFTFIYIVNCGVSGEIYTAGKNFTLAPAVTAWTNLTSAMILSSETYFTSQPENKDNGGGGDGAQYFIGLHFDEIASGCPLNFGLAAPRERTTACRRCTRNFFNAYFSGLKIRIPLFSFCTFLGFRYPYFSLSFGRIFLCFRDFYAFHSSCTDYDLHDLRGRLELNISHLCNHLGRCNRFHYLYQHCLHLVGYH